MFFRNVTITQQYLERVRILKWVCKDTVLYSPNAKLK